MGLLTMAAALAVTARCRSDDPRWWSAGCSSIICSPRPACSGSPGYVGRERLDEWSSLARHIRVVISVFAMLLAAICRAPAVSRLLGEMASDPEARRGRALCLDRDHAVRIAAGSGLSVPMVRRDRPSDSQTRRAMPAYRAGLLPILACALCSSSADALPPPGRHRRALGCSCRSAPGFAVCLLDGCPAASNACYARARIARRRLMADP